MRTAPLVALVLAALVVTPALIGCLGTEPTGGDHPIESAGNTSTSPDGQGHAGVGGEDNGTDRSEPDGAGDEPNNTAEEEPAANASEPAGAPERYDPGWPPIDEAVVRPGVKLFDRLTDQLGLTDEPLRDVRYYHCSSNFLFSSPDNRSLYLGTASHCLKVFEIGDTIPLAQGRANGTIVYCSYGTISATNECPDLTNGTEESHPNDFALIRIADEDRGNVHPAVLHLGGPTGLAASIDPGQEAWTYGNTDYRDARRWGEPDPLDARRGRVYDQDAWTTRIVFDPASLPGDSGSLAMTATGEALGIVQWMGWFACPGPRADVVGVVNLDHALAYMERHTDLRVELVTWPLLDEPVIPQPTPETSCGEPAGSHRSG